MNVNFIKNHFNTFFYFIGVGCNSSLNIIIQNSTLEIDSGIKPGDLNAAIKYKVQATIAKVQNVTVITE
jgi:hypothetical protein